MPDNVVPIRPHLPPAREALRWHEAFESVAASNLRILSAWQRMVWRALWRL